MFALVLLTDRAEIGEKLEHRPLCYARHTARCTDAIALYEGGYDLLALCCIEFVHAHIMLERSGIVNGETNLIRTRVLIIFRTQLTSGDVGDMFKEKKEQPQVSTVGREHLRLRLATEVVHDNMISAAEANGRGDPSRCFGC